MMDDHEFCDDCFGCRPAIATVNPDNTVGPPMPQDHPAMVKINKYWDNETTYAQRKAFIEVTLHNSRISVEMKLANQVMERIRTIMQEAG